MRADRIARAAEGRGEGITGGYSRVKWDHLQTGDVCAREGFTFVPTIFEAHRGGGASEPEEWQGLSLTTNESGDTGVRKDTQSG